MSNSSNDGDDTAHDGTNPHQDAPTPRRGRKGHHGGNRGIRQHPIERKALALAYAPPGTPLTTGAAVAGVPVSTIHRWRQRFMQEPESELEAFMGRENAVAGPVWAVLRSEGQALAMERREAGDAKGFKDAMIGAGVADTKVVALGNPKAVAATVIDADPLPDDAPSEPHP